MKYIVVWGGVVAILAVLWLFYRPKRGKRPSAQHIGPRRSAVKASPETVSDSVAIALRAQVREFLAPDNSLIASARDSRSIGYVLGWVESTFGAHGHDWESATTRNALAAVFSDLFGEEGNTLLARCARLHEAEDGDFAIGRHEGSVDASRGMRRSGKADGWRTYLRSKGPT